VVKSGGFYRLCGINSTTTDFTLFFRYREFELAHSLPERIFECSGFSFLLETDDEVICVSNKPGEAG
jgi:hypothetical protein